jgi:hypothetical protein
VLPDGALAVSFERVPRIWRYPTIDARPEPLPRLPGIERAPGNGGVEALMALADGRLFALTEYWIRGPAIQGWIQDGKRWRRVGLAFDGAFRPSDAARLPSGAVLLLERAYAEDRGIVSVRLRRVPAAALRSRGPIRGELLAELECPLQLDNFEGIDVVAGSAGETLVYLVSDDNFSPLQRTLLLQFVLNGEP